VTRRVLVVLAAALATRALADPTEPPLGADPNADYVAEPSDSAQAGSVEYAYALSGTNGSSLSRRQSFAFEGDSVELAVREGDDEPYGGGGLQARGGTREFRAGRVAPRWGLGLVLGTPREPWSGLDEGARAPWEPRARSGDGALCRWRTSGVEAMCAQFGHRTLAGVGMRRGIARVGLVGGPQVAPRASLGTEADDGSAEFALDPTGAWRSEAVVRHGNELAPWLLRVRAGHRVWRPLADPKRIEPARLLSVTHPWRVACLDSRLSLAAWGWARDTAGARAALETEWPLGDGGRVRAGFEEQHGTWRLRTAARHRGLRQGVWLEWRGGPPTLALVVRHEVWGESPFARDLVRSALGAGAEARLPRGASLTVSHTVYRARSGETLYLAERDADRWVLRALSGAGQRSRLTLRVPFSGGEAQSELVLQPVRGVPRPRWSLRWSRRVRLRS